MKPKQLLNSWSPVSPEFPREALRIENRIPVVTAGMGAAVGASVDALHEGRRMRLVYRRR